MYANICQCMPIYANIYQCMPIGLEVISWQPKDFIKHKSAKIIFKNKKHHYGKYVLKHICINFLNVINASHY